MNLSVCIAHSSGFRPDHLAHCLATIPTSLRAILGDPGDGIWNRSRALNNAIRDARTEYIVTTDCDIMFSVRFWEAVEHALMDNRDLLLSEAWDLGEGDAWPATPRGRQGKGGFCLFPRKVWEELGGYDEAYTFWGAEDEDWAFRVERHTGREFLWIEDLYGRENYGARIYHQWHPKVQLDKPEEIKAYQSNRIRLAQTREGKLPLVRNR